MSGIFTKSMARNIFYGGTTFFFLLFLALTFDTERELPNRDNRAAITPEVAAGKHIWETRNCLGCHTLLGEGAYYAPELTKVFERRGPVFIRAMLTDPEKMYPGQRRMWKYDFSERDKDDLIAFFQWIGKVDLNGFPPKPTLAQMATTSGLATTVDRPQIFNQLCVACHALGGQGGQVGPALDGVGNRKTPAEIAAWLADPPAIKPGTQMPKLPLTDGQRQELTAFLSTLK